MRRDQQPLHPVPNHHPVPGDVRRDHRYPGGERLQHRHPHPHARGQRLLICRAHMRRVLNLGQQVNLQVRIAEVSRSLVRAIGVNLTSIDSSSGFQFGIGQGRGADFFAPGTATGVNVGDYGKSYDLNLYKLLLNIENYIKRYIVTAIIFKYK